MFSILKRNCLSLDVQSARNEFGPAVVKYDPPWIVCVA
ncbi:hypothetical protein Agau_P200098 (plasmid) [Agrobacterium tumefaciens F2]|nr:hypothetical protein Agau_P200098 [Agrobacterium tumefaciens F2]